MSIFKVSKKEMDKLTKAVMKDIGEEIRDNLQDELIHMEPYYSENLAPSIVYDETAHLVGSEHWGAAAIDDGTDWRWSKFPNIDKLKEWVRNRKDDGKYASASDYEVSKIAFAVGKKIKDSGIDPTFYVKSVMGLFHRQVGLDY